MPTKSKRRKISKPPKPYAGFPLQFHNSGRFAKKYRLPGKATPVLYYYGRWAHVQSGKLIQVENMPQAIADAKAAFDRYWPFDSTGKDRPVEDGDDAADGPLLLKDLCNEFLTSKVRKVNTNRMSPRTMIWYRKASETVIDQFGSKRIVEDLKPKDFEKLMEFVAGSRTPGGQANMVRHIRILFRWAYESDLIDRPVKFGPEFKAPSRASLRAAEQQTELEHGKRLLKASELRKLVKHLAAEGKPADKALVAMIYLGVNCGMGQADCANLQKGHLDLERGWLRMPRVKTAIDRACPLWPETVAALKAALAVRPAPKSADDQGCVFITRIGHRWLQVSTKQTDMGPSGSVTDTIGAAFSRVLRELGMKRHRVSFYALRHITETIGGGAKDQVALDRLMGHADQSMASRYREDFDDARLRAVTDHLREWFLKSKG